MTIDGASQTGRIYLDHNATSPMPVDVRARLRAHLDAPLHNPGSIHAEGQRSRGVIERARRTIVESIGPGGSVVFTSGATESNHLALLGAPDARMIALGRLEHPSVLGVAALMEARGCRVRWLRHDHAGRLDLADLKAALDEGVDLVAMMAANNEIGNLNPIDGAAALCRSAGVRMHVDAAQIVGRWRWCAPAGVTSVTASAHKAGGPLGVGALWIAEGAAVVPQLVGGHQQRGRRAGTEVAWLADGWAATFAPGVAGRWELLGKVREAFEDTMRVLCDCVVHGDRDARLLNTSNLGFPGRVGEELVMALDLAGVSVSSGSACTAGSVEPSAVLLALGLDADAASSAVRFSFGPEHARADGTAIAARVAAAITA